MSLLQENPGLRQFVEEQATAFAMFCDQKLLTRDEGIELAEAASEAIEYAAEDRPSIDARMVASLFPRRRMCAPLPLGLVPILTSNCGLFTTWRSCCSR